MFASLFFEDSIQHHNTGLITGRATTLFTTLTSTNTLNSSTYVLLCNTR